MDRCLMLILFFIFPIVIMPLSFLAAGLYLIIVRRPVLLPYRWVLYPMLPFVFSIGLAPVILFHSYHHDLMSLISGPLLLLLFMVALLKGGQGYMVLGDGSMSALRDALVAVLNKMGIDFQETLGSIKLLSAGAELQVSRGCLIFIKPGSSSHLLDEISRAMNVYFQENNIKTGLISSAAYFAIFVLTFGPLVFAFCFIPMNNHGQPVLNGVIKSYYTTGAVRYEYQYTHGQREGVTKEYYPNGILAREWGYHNGHLDGLTKEYYPTGELKAEYVLINLRLEGPQKIFYKDGKLKAENIYENGKIKSIKRYSEDGQLLWERTFKWSELKSVGSPMN